MLPAATFLLFFLGCWLIVRFWGPYGLALLRRMWGTRGGRRAAQVRKTPWVLLAIIAAAVALTALAGRVLLSGTVTIIRVDEQVQSAMRRWISDDATLFFRSVTWLGDPVVLTFVAAVAGVVFWVRGRPAWAIYIWLTSSTGGLLNRVMKNVFARERPTIDALAEEVSSYAFPSGHSMGSIVVYSALAWAAARVLPSWRKESLVTASAITLVVMIGTSRIYLGVHWLSDVLGGFAAGLAWVATVTTAFELWLRRNAEKHESLKS